MHHGLLCSVTSGVGRKVPANSSDSESLSRKLETISTSRREGVRLSQGFWKLPGLPRVSPAASPKILSLWISTGSTKVSQTVFGELPDFPRSSPLEEGF